MTTMNLKQMFCAGLLGLLTTVGCSTYQVIPDRLEGQVRQDVPLLQVRESPETYQGQLVAWGGEVLNVARRESQMQVEVLELPLDRTLRPLEEAAASRGRFLAIDSHDDIKDEARLKKGTLVTVIGTVQGLTKMRLDQDTYEAPTLTIRDMTAWERQVGVTRYPFGSPFVGYRPFIFWDTHRVAEESRTR